LGELVVIPPGQLTLFDLATIANEEHALAQQAFMSAVRHGIAAGEALIEAKARPDLRHGEWLPWLDGNFVGSRQTAQVYMLLAKSQRAGLLTGDEASIRRALEAIPKKTGNYTRNAAGAHEGAEIAVDDARGDDWMLLLGDFRERLAAVPTGSVTAIVTDPPYPEEYLPLWGNLGAAAARILEPGGVLVARSGHLFLPDVLELLGEHLQYGWVYVETLPGSNVRFIGRQIAVHYMPWVAFSNGPWPSGRIEWHPDVLAESRRSKGRYVWEQAPSVAAELTATLAPAGSTVVDPFAGSGSYGEAALGVGCRWVGCELDPAGHAQAAERLRGLAA
jgi:16S rRNA G966 N2-methylase RsmD